MHGLNVKDYEAIHFLFIFQTLIIQTNINDVYNSDLN
jgi:hypothetical protein